MINNKRGQFWNIRSSTKEGTKKGISTLRIIKAVGALLLLLIFGWLTAEWIVIPLTKIVPTVGVQITSTALNVPAWLNSILTVLVGAGAVSTWESLIAALAIFAIILFGLYDIIYNFSTFSAGTSWAIAAGLGIIAGVTKVISSLVTVIFGGIATIGAIGIGIIVVWAVIMAVLMNIIIGMAGIRAMREASKSQEQIAKVGRTMRKGYGVFKEAAGVAEEA